MDVEQNEAALIRAVEPWNSGDVGSYLELYGQGIKLHAGTYDFPDKKSVEDKLAARYAVTGTHTGELMGIPATGREISITGITIMQCSDFCREHVDSGPTGEPCGCGHPECQAA